MSRAWVIDTGPLVAFIDHADHHHSWAEEALSNVAPPLETCDAVIAEAWHLLGRARRGRATLLGLLQARMVQVTFGLSTELTAVTRLMAKYADQPMSVADGCLVRMAELNPAATIVTLDRDFTVYRRGRSALRLLAPFS